MTRKEIAELVGTRDNNMDSEIVSVVGGNYVRIRVDSEKRVRLVTDISTEMLRDVVRLFNKGKS